MSGELFDAVLRGDVSDVAEALRAGADVDAMQAEWPGWRPLHVAIEAIDEEGASLEILRVLLEHGADVDGLDRRNDATPLLMAACRFQPESVRLLLAHGADADVSGGDGETALRWAAAEGDAVMVDILLAHGVKGSIDVAGSCEGTTPLGAASVRGRVEIVDRLLAAGADPTAKDHDGYTAEERARRELARASGERAEQLEVIVERLHAVTRRAGAVAE